MGVKKRPLSGGSVPRSKARRADSPQGVSIPSNVELLRRKKPHLDKVLEKSIIFVRLGKAELSQLRDVSLFELGERATLELSEEDDVSYLSLSYFNALQLAQVLAFIFANRSKQWLGKKNDKNALVPLDLPLRGGFFINKTCKVRRRIQVSNGGSISISRVIDLNYFREVAVDFHGVAEFLEAVARFMTTVRFQMSPTRTRRAFRESLRESRLGLNISMASTLYLERGLLIDHTAAGQKNTEAVDKSRKALNTFVQTLMKYNEHTPEEQRSDTQSERVAVTGSGAARRLPASSSRYNNNNMTNSTNDVPPASNGRTLDPQSRTMNSNFLSQEQITEYCIATIKASIEAVKSKSPYQIIKTYIKCPRQHYVDLVYDNLSSLRSETNCNIVVLNLNNVHESTSWFDSLKISKFTKVTSVPHPSTVRVVSIGGIGEHNVKSLQLLLKLFSNPSTAQAQLGT